MDSTERISQLSHRIFNTTLTEKRVGRSSNPFATPSFNGAIDLIKSDVFTKSAPIVEGKMGLSERITQGTKRIAALYVSSINNVKNIFNAGITAMKEFGAKVVDGVVSVWNKVNEIGSKEVSLDIGGIGKRMMEAISTNSKQKELEKLSQCDVGKLADDLNFNIKGLEASLKIGKAEENLSLVA